MVNNLTGNEEFGASVPVYTSKGKLKFPTALSTGRVWKRDTCGCTGM
uniref:Uncharacterized protein n=1 Tax=Rhizophora mucronata TaxID=61149 RepID=A0A2P2NQE4_RHIMU